MPETGQKPGIGIYICDICGNRVTIYKNSDRLPQCSVCNGINYGHTKVKETEQSKIFNSKDYFTSQYLNK